MPVINKRSGSQLETLSKKLMNPPPTQVGRVRTSHLIIKTPCRISRRFFFENSNAKADIEILAVRCTLRYTSAVDSVESQKSVRLTAVATRERQTAGMTDSELKMYQR